MKSKVLMAFSLSYKEMTSGAKTLANAFFAYSLLNYFIQFHKQRFAKIQLYKSANFN